VISELLSWEKTEGHDDETKEVRQKLLTLVANYLTTDLRRLLRESGAAIGNCKISPENFAEFVDLIHTSKLSSRGAKDLLPEMVKTGGDPHQLMLDSGLGQVSEAGELESAADKVIEKNSEAVTKYKSGNENTLQFLVGQLMKETKGAANPQVAAEILKKKNRVKKMTRLLIGSWSSRSCGTIYFIPYCSFASSMVLERSMATVIGPTPPGTGVM